jgi:hypothetical protein
VAATNFGIYCRCGEFVVFSVLRGEPVVELEFIADQPVPILCPYCRTRNIGTLKVSFSWCWTRRTFGDTTDIRQPSISVTFLASGLSLREFDAGLGPERL